MEYTSLKSEHVTTYRLKGQFTFSDAANFKPIIELVKTKSAKTILLDFEDVTFVDSASLGMLLMLRDECEQVGIQLQIQSVKGQVEKIFTISKFDQLFSIAS